MTWTLILIFHAGVAIMPGNFVAQDACAKAGHVAMVETNRAANNPNASPDDLARVATIAWSCVPR